ncbi:PilZ domain-containing protein [Methylobacterium fujisawaense]|uniref:PilZ domain-containing protein n=1 Tax=Methylobacterium fujisawaense TaxID=107400 RepID=UPI00313EA5C7
MGTGGILKSEQPGGHVDRREERRETDWIALIRLPDGTEIPTTVKYISPSGARLTVPSSYTLPDQFMFEVVGRAFVCAVRLAWRRGDHIGVRIERIGKLAPPSTEGPAPSVEPAAILRARRSRFSQI